MSQQCSFNIFLQLQFTISSLILHNESSHGLHREQGIQLCTVGRDVFGYRYKNCGASTSTVKPYTVSIYGMR